MSGAHPPLLCGRPVRCQHVAMTDSKSRVTRCRFLLVCILAAGALTTARAAPPLPLPTAPSATDATLAAKCKAASFARRPAGQMATTMRDMQIKRCIKNHGILID